MKAKGQCCGISPQKRRTSQKTPTQVHPENTDVHWIPDQSIQADNNQLLRRIPGGQRASAHDEEVTHAPKQNSGAEQQYRPSPNGSFGPPMIPTGDPVREHARHNCGKSKERGQRPENQQIAPQLES